MKSIDNVQYHGKKPYDSRNQFKTISEMISFPSTSIDEGHISYVEETKKYYTFNSSNELDPTLGHWREFGNNNSSNGDLQLVEREW